MNKCSCLCLLIVSTVIFSACSKNKGLSDAAVIGRWQYHNSTFDTSGVGRSAPAITAYDPGFAALLGESLEFKKGDTVIYNYKGASTWSNYRVNGNQLILVGSAANDTLHIYSLTSNQLIIGWQQLVYKANYIRQ